MVKQKVIFISLSNGVFAGVFICLKQPDHLPCLNVSGHKLANKGHTEGVCLCLPSGQSLNSALTGVLSLLSSAPFCNVTFMR